MNFMEAVEQMKLGKKVRRNHWSCREILFSMRNIGNDTEILWDDTNNKKAIPCSSLFINNDWEVCPSKEELDKDWVLINYVEVQTETYNHFTRKNVKKCRNLLEKDGLNEIHSMREQKDDFKRGYVSGIEYQLRKERERFGEL